MTRERMASLSEARRRLIRLMQNINFGAIGDLEVRGGEPMFSPPPRVVREIKFGGENGPRADPDRHRRSGSPQRHAAPLLLTPSNSPARSRRISAG